ncbi:MAG: flavodoxin [Hyphomicrobiaceae bacterium]|nr:flavodoxin [Hyphomicrobiaceae bacterium]
MSMLIVYYSRSGNTRGVVNELVEAVGAEAEELQCPRYTRGMLDWILAVYDSVRGRLPDIAPLRRDPAAYDLVLVAGPVWASHAATPVRTFLERYGPSLERVAFLVTLGGSGADKALAEMGALSGKRPIATLALTQAELGAGRDRRKLYDFATKLKAAS